ncbi:hypothetical protein EN792_058670, partial [Mesorhizobium sp. M00.F.Ca.ET.149.01.1.1]
AGPVSEVAAEMAELEAAMADPDQADRMDEIIEKYGEAQHRFEVGSKAYASGMVVSRYAPA